MKLDAVPRGPAALNAKANVGRGPPQISDEASCNWWHKNATLVGRAAWDGVV